MPRIIVEHFCGLSSNSIWQNWLYNHDAALYKELIEHLRAGKGCAQNRAKMAEIMAVITRTAEGKMTLMEFLQARFPAVLEHDSPRPVITTLPPAVPFTITNPNLLTFPRRKIIEDNDPIALQEAVRRLSREQLRCQYVILGNKAYVEYVPVEHAHVLDKIPEKNWLVPAFKRTQQ